MPIDIKAMPSQVSYAGWRMGENGIPAQITADRESNQSALAEIQSYARRLGLDARNVEFYVVKTTTSYETLSKTIFEVTAKTELVETVVP